MYPERISPATKILISNKPAEMVFRGVIIVVSDFRDGCGSW